MFIGIWALKKTLGQVKGMGQVWGLLVMSGA